MTAQAARLWASRWALAALLVALLATSGRATPADSTSARATPTDSASAPSFSGRWKLSIPRSSFGKIPGGQPTARTNVIDHSGTRIRQTLYLLKGARRDTTVYVYSIDGTPTVNKVDGRDIRSTVRWEGRTLHLLSTARLVVLQTSLDERWTLTPDRRTLTFTRHVKYGFGEGDQTLVFEREK